MILTINRAVQLVKLCRDIMKTYKYYIDGDGGSQGYNTLDDVRSHVWCCNEQDREGYRGLIVDRTFINQKGEEETDPNFARKIDIKGSKVILRKIYPGRDVPQFI